MPLPDVVWHVVAALAQAAPPVLLQRGLGQPVHGQLIDVVVIGAHHQALCGGEVDGVRGVVAEHAVAEAHLGHVERLAVDGLVVAQPRAGLVLGNVEVLGHDRGQIARVVLGLVDLRPQVLLLLDGAESGVGLDPARLVRPLLAGVQLVDERYAPVVHELAVEQLARVVVLLVKEHVALEAVGGYLEYERLLSGGSGLLHEVEEVPVGDGVKLVNHGQLHV